MPSNFFQYKGYWPIAQHILDNFLQRKLFNNDIYKNLVDEELDNKIASLTPIPNITQPLWYHQKISFLLGTQHKNFLYFTKPGGGKTAVVLYLIDWYKQLNPSTKTLFISDSHSNSGNIQKEVNIWTPHLTSTVVIGSKQIVKDIVKQSSSDILIMSYDALQTYASKWHDNTVKGKRKVIIDEIETKWFANQFDIVIFDEIANCKSVKTITYNTCKILSQCIPIRYGLAGRPFSRDPVDLWAQFNLIDNGETLGSNIEIYKQAFFKSQRLKIKNLSNPLVVWKLDSSKKEQLSLVIKNKSIYFSDEECQKLPGRIIKPIYVTLSSEAKDYYLKIRGDLITSFVDQEWRSKIKNHFAKLRQVCSGFLQVTDTIIDDDGKETASSNIQEIEFDNSKEKWLRQIISLIPKTDKFIIFYEFTPSGKRVDKLLTSIGIQHVWLYGKTKQKDKIPIVKEFQDNPECKSMLVNTKSGSTGLNLQQANHAIFYELGTSGISHVQATYRIFRGAQTKTCFEYHFIVKKSVEEKIKEFLEEGEELFKSIIEGKHIDKNKIVSSDFINSINKKNVLDKIGNLT